MRRLIGVDVDGQALEIAAHDCTPGIGDWHFRRPHEFTVILYRASILEQHLALPFQPQCVTLIEVIEHIYPEFLSNLAYTIFAYINPETVIVSTPNRDFNVHFPDPKQLRNDDHKFEWSREEFGEF
jgi:2-polyprenyl-3-methyl-5-hydroxy-6-metoxy-1,4-benzoquinol methylase